MAPSCLQKEELLEWKLQRFPVLYGKRVKASKCETWFNMSRTKVILQKLVFLLQKEFTVHRCFVINHIETAAVEFDYDKVGGFMPLTFRQ